MRSNLQNLVFSSAFLLIVSCGCPSGYFTQSNPCDTEAALIQSSEYTSVDIQEGKWKYFYLPLSGFGNSFVLTFKMDDPSLQAYVNFKQADQYQLPTDASYAYQFQAKNGDLVMPLEMLTFGLSLTQGRMLLGIYNSDDTMRNVQIRYYLPEKSDSKGVFNQVIIVVVIAVLAVVLVVFGFGFYIQRLMRRRRIAIQEARGILIIEGQTPKSPDALTLKEFEKYFPKQSFDKLENQFQQAGCSICLEDFTAETESYQLYCNHIFHEKCIQTWLEKQNNCPTCRVPLGKKSIEEFMEAQKKQKEVEVITPTAINIRGSYTYGESQQVTNESSQQIQA